MPTYTISELAQEFQITPRAIRFYEDHGLLAPKRTGPNGMQRVYSSRDRTRLKLTLRGKRLGLTLVQIAQLVNMYDSPKDSSAQLKKFVAVLDEHKGRLVQQLEDLKLTLEEIDQHRARAVQELDQLEADGKSNPATAELLNKRRANNQASVRVN